MKKFIIITTVVLMMPVMGFLSLMIFLGAVAVPCEVVFGNTPGGGGSNVVVQPNGVTLSTAGLTVKGAPMTKHQAKNAATIIGVISANELPERAALIALITVTTESEMENLTYGDRDSVGLFQQREPWGTFESRTDPVTSTDMFLYGGSDSDGYSEPGLMDIEGWQDMAPGDAAQTVQVSAYPDAYAEWIDEAQRTLDAATVKSKAENPDEDADSVSQVTLNNEACGGDDTTDPVEVAVRAALSRVGTQYAWAQDGAIFDGSGLVWWSFRQAGVDVPNDAGMLFEYDGDEKLGITTERLTYEDVLSGDKPLQRGDLIFISLNGTDPLGANSESIVRVMFYLGNDKYLSADKGDGDIYVHPMDEDFEFAGALRLNAPQQDTAATGKWTLPVKNYTITDTWGGRIHPTTGEVDFHNGVDFAASIGTEIHAASSGKVVVATYDDAWGNYVVIDHGRNILTLYAHMRDFASGLSEGKEVATGDVIGYVDSTGWSSGDHLHFNVCTSMECTAGEEAGAVNPLPFLQERGLNP